ncbi:DNA-directed RNA polymerase IV subunit 1 isoform X1 [Lycium ferocissimum]|uniref:DNA-directed RNA polymerase IV subunit 1 isoform X1 n=1 Tax=Lycium ferocissimum TaxID=112874 RepID=UPI002814FDF0|nr:DNA-directed RNA polymerase IV subunit 1 isoform X1 [Lycium ferocissimum]XP_059276068.1 DNA-directed RNA polymerase IV subunit 1 isoform X1 [Lycium ferocissimum]XP_059276069.1 DNA-directed RNA polymerase IV subunit 1 isoform X1 [Lycium ferocissimum]XP_059276070.1 DNA-directed RNA polymerase IV subunit 1 isoform X1 [Lycium ferocissimum]XP_059276071.1 DNA-directed RNA polymerase IV subunit 1 isoform X1 [Lycium ferocissimum]
MERDLNIELQVPEGTLRGINFNILSETDAAKLSAKVIGAVNEVTDPALGFPNPIFECSTCGAKDGKNCEGHLGLIIFPYTILNPYFVSEVAQILKKICPGCKSVRRDKVKGADRTSACKYCDGILRGYPPTKFKVSPRDTFGRTAIIAEVNENLLKKLQHTSGGSLASDYWDFIPYDAQQDASLNSSKYKRVLSHAQVYSILKDVDPGFLEGLLKRKNSIFLNSCLLTPNCHRVTEFGQHMIFDESNRHFRKMIDFRGTANDLSVCVLDRIKASKIRAERSIINDPNAPATGLKYVKELVLAKRTNHAFRMVVVGDPNIELGEIGIPRHVAENLHFAEPLSSRNWEKLTDQCDLMILQKGRIVVRRNGVLVPISVMDQLHRGDIIYRPLIDGDVVLINRPPSIHQHSLVALSVRILPINSVLSINPLVCSPFRGDFDGDCLHGYIPQSVDSRIELNELVALNQQLIDGQNGQNLLSLSHDSLTAAHLILEQGVFLDQFQMQQLQMFCPRQAGMPAILRAPSGNKCYWTGKQLFSLFLPSDLEYNFPSNDVCISEGEIVTSSGGSSWLHDSSENLFYSLVKRHGGETLDLLYAAQTVLCEWLSMRGLSVSLSDLYISSNPYSRENMIDEVFSGLQEAERLSYIQLLMIKYNKDFLAGSLEESKNSMGFDLEFMSIMQQKSASLSQASATAFKKVFRDVQNLVYNYASNENSFLAMLKAGSKGNLLKLVQHSMCLGLQQSLVPLSFRMPRQLSCDAWNNHKSHRIFEKAHNNIPCAVVENSFLAGLNPLECFVHSLTTRDSSFSGHADVSGTLNRKLMFFMRDVYVGYDGTVRNAYGNQIVQFSYYETDRIASTKGTGDADRIASHAIGGHPVGSLAACAISEAAYSALDQPVSALESSPLLNLKKILESGVGSRSGEKTASLFLSKRLGRWAYGFEYGALEVKGHLERLLLSDVVSTVMICFSSETHKSSHSSPWVCHFHIDKENVKTKRLKLRSVLDALNMRYHAARKKAGTDLPNLHMTCKDCSVAEARKENSRICITVAVAETSKESFSLLDTLRVRVIPFLLETVIKGFSAFKKVDILWRELPSTSKSGRGSTGELYLQVFMSESCDRIKFWNALVDSCLQIRDLIDWDRSHPDDVHDLTVAYGIDVAWDYFLCKLHSAVSDTGKKILPEHLVLAADCLTATGEFVPLSAKGLTLQRKAAGVVSPFMQACFSNPGDSFVRAAKMGLSDDLQGSLESLAWGKSPSIGSGSSFEIIYSGKGYEPAKPTDVYALLRNHVTSNKPKVKVTLNEGNEMAGKSLAQRLYKLDDLNKKCCRSQWSIANLRKFLSFNDIKKLSQALKQILSKYAIDCALSEADKSLAMMALHFHPRRSEKIGKGALEIKIGYHKEYEDSRCFMLVRTDGTVEDFSYRKCLQHALELIAPQKAKTYKWLNGASGTSTCNC